jgi:hypothetical protein
MKKIIDKVLLLQTARYLLKCAQNDTTTTTTSRAHMLLVSPLFDERVKPSAVYKRYEHLISLYTRLYERFLSFNLSSFFLSFKK